MELPADRVAKAFNETRGSARDKGEAAIKALANLTDAEWHLAKRYLRTDSQTNLWAALDALADMAWH